MSAESIKFDYKKLKKRTSTKKKKIFSRDDIGFNKILVSKKEPYSINKVFK